MFLREIEVQGVEVVYLRQSNNFIAQLYLLQLQVLMERGNFLPMKLGFCYMTARLLKISSNTS